MPNKRRFHLPNREWSKIIRFNGVDYLLSSLFDRNFDFGAEYKKSLDFDFDGEYDKNIVRQKKLFRKPQKLNHRVVEDFFDEIDLEDELIDDADVLSIQFMVNTKDGDYREIESSKDPIKNKIFASLIQLIILNDPSEKINSVDNILKKSGKDAYMMNISEIVYVNGCLRFEVVNAINLSSYLKIFSTDGMDTKIMLKSSSYISRLKNHDLVVMDKDQFDAMVKYNIVYDEKNMI